MKQLQHILMPTDFSELADHALQTALAICRQHQACLHLLHVPDNGDKEKARDKLDQLAEEIRKKEGIRVEVHVQDPELADVIRRMTQSGYIDLVVMGNKGAAGFREFLGGSRTLKMVRVSEVPLLTVPPNKKISSFRKILFPVRVSKNFLHKFHLLEPLIDKEETELVIVGLTKPGEKYNLGPEDERILALGETLRRKGIIFRTAYFSTENMGHQLLELADTENADLIVINASLEYKWRQEFIAPYTQYVVDHARIPVLSVRDAEPEIHLDEQLKERIRKAGETGLNG